MAQRCAVELLFKGGQTRRLLVDAGVDAFLAVYNNAFHFNQPLTVTNRDGHPFFEFNPRNVSLCDVTPAAAPDDSAESAALASL